MKTGLLTLAALSAVAVAQPQHGAHKHRHEKKQAVAYATVTDVTYVTAAPEMVYVDQNGNPVNQPAATSAAQEQAPKYEAPKYEAPPAAPVYSAPVPSYVAPAQEYSAPAYSAPAYSAPAYSAPAYSAPAASSSSTPSSTPSSGSSSGDGHGITYSPYNSDQSCKTADQIAKDLATLDGYNMIRMYGVDCDQAGPIIKAAKAKDMKVFAGLFEITGIEAQIEKLKSAVEENADWSIIDTVSVGNEGINNGQYSISDIRAAVNTAKACLSDVFTGSVVTVDTFIAVINNPELCTVGDYTATNCHAFFDGGVPAEKSGKWVLEQAQRVSEACGNPDRKVVITEAGWPSAGTTNNLAVPSKENQAAAVQDLKDHFTSNLILFTAFNDYWKVASPDTHFVEQHWGIYGDCPSS